MDIDYGEVFGLDMTGAEGTETAEPSEQPTEQGANEQETAEPAGQEDAQDDGIAAGEEPEDEGAEDQASGQQSREENSKYAAARRKAEQERDQAIAKARQEAQEQARKQVDEAIAGMGLKDPYTGKAITSKAEYDAYQERHTQERKNRILKKSGITDAEFTALVQAQPEIQKAKAATAQAEAATRQAREAQARSKIDDQIKQISAMNPAITSMQDLTKMDNYQQFYDLVKKGNSLTDAYKLANFETLTQQTAQSAKQAALNNTQSKQHLSQSKSRGSGAARVPREVAEEYRALNPGATDAEISKHYNQYLKR